MKELRNFDNWSVIEDTPFGSGASRKYWLFNGEEKGIFKFPKISEGKITGEYWAESLAYEIANILNISCAKIDMGTYHGELGSMSYMLLNKGEALIEGITFISKLYLDYDKNTFYSEISDMWYSLEMIKNSLEEFGLFEDFLKIPIFDCLIGNSDRHHSNWAIIESEKGEKRISPLYDNGSSLCSIENEDKISLRDKNWINARIYSKSKSMIRIKNKQKRPTHHEVLEYITKYYYEETKDFAGKIADALSDNAIKNLLEDYPDDIISESVKSLLFLFITMRRDMVLKAYFGGEIAHD